MILHSLIIYRNSGNSAARIDKKQHVLPKRYKRQTAWIRRGSAPQYWPYHLVRRKAEVFFASGGWDKAEALYRSNIQMSAGDQTLSAEARSGLAKLIVNRGKIKESNDLLESAQRIFSDLGDRARLAPVLRGRGVVCAYQGNFRRAQRFFAAAAAMARRSGDRAEFSHALGNLGIAYKSQGNYSKALECYRQEMTISEETGDLMNLASAFNNQGLVYKEMRRFGEALEHFEKALQIAERIGDRSTASYSYGNMGTVHHDRGSFSQALDMYQRRLELTIHLGDRQSAAYTRINMGLLEKQRGNYDEAEKLYNESLETMDQLGDRRAVAIVTGKLADLYSTTGRRELARQNYQNAVDKSRQLGIDYYLCDMLLHFALLALEENDPRESSELAASARVSAEKSGRKDLVLSCRILQARLLSHEDRERSISDLKTLEGECPEDEQRAEALYHLYRIEPEEQLKEKLLKLYGTLWERTPDHKYRVRINEIAGPAGSQPGEPAA